MCFLYKNAVKKWGMLLMVSYMLIGMGILIYVKSAHNISSSRYYPSKVRGEYNGNIAISVLFFFFAFIGIIAFYCESKIFLFCYGLVHSIIILFTFIMAVISLQINNYPTLIGDYTCNKTVNSTNFPKSNIDAYLIEIDKVLCSSNCPCKINNLTEFKERNPNITDLANDTQNGALSFLGCPFSAKKLAWENANITDQIISFPENTLDKYDFDIGLFADTWAFIENQYSCSGFCVENYTNANNSIIGFNKYLFGDVNKKPDIRGCLDPMTRNVTRYFGIYGGLAIFLFFLQLTVSYCACSFCCGKEEFVYETIYSKSIQVQTEVELNAARGSHFDNRI